MEHSGNDEACFVCVSELEVSEVERGLATRFFGLLEKVRAIGNVQGFEAVKRLQF